MKTNTKIVLLVVTVIGTGLLMMFIAFSVLIYFVHLEEMDKEEFLYNGKRGKAKVLKLSEDTRYKQNQAILVLEVSVPNYKTYQTQLSERILPIHAPKVQPGLIIDVLVDPHQPNNPKRILLLLDEDTLEKERNRR
jgi:hypothetical protein